MMQSGILWYDDDSHRTIDEKIAEAANRFRERLGFEPTACELNAAQAAAPAPTKAAARRVRRAAAKPLHALRLVPTDHLRPNYFFVGVAAGERLVRVKGWSDDVDDYEGAATRRPVAGMKRRPAAPAARNTLRAAMRVATPSAPPVATVPISAVETPPAATQRTPEKAAKTASDGAFAGPQVRKVAKTATAAPPGAAAAIPAAAPRERAAPRVEDTRRAAAGKKPKAPAAAHSVDVPSPREAVNATLLDKPAKTATSPTPGLRARRNPAISATSPSIAEVAETATSTQKPAKSATRRATPTVPEKASTRARPAVPATVPQAASAADAATPKTRKAAKTAMPAATSKNPTTPAKPLAAPVALGRNPGQTAERSSTRRAPAPTQDSLAIEKAAKTANTRGAPTLDAAPAAVTPRRKTAKSAKSASPASAISARTAALEQSPAPGASPRKSAKTAMGHTSAPAGADVSAAARRKPSKGVVTTARSPQVTEEVTPTGKAKVTAMRGRSAAPKPPKADEAPGGVQPGAARRPRGRAPSPSASQIGLWDAPVAAETPATQRKRKTA